MAALDQTSFASALKVHYTKDRVLNMVYKDNPFLAMLSKMTDFGGKNLPIPIIWGNSQGASQDFSTAKSNKKASKISDFVLTRNHYYSLASISSETILASQGDANAFFEAVTHEIDSAIDTIKRQLAIALYRNGSGSIGRLGTSTVLASSTITLDDVESVTNFEVGQVLVVSGTDGGGSVRVGEVEVTAVDRDNGTLTTSAVLNVAIPTIAAQDFLFREGDYDNAIKGLQAWIPNTAPTSTPFFSVDRSVDVTRLGGIRSDGSNQPIEEALISAASRVAREGGKPDVCFMSYAKFADLEKALGSKVQYIDLKVNAEIGFRGMVINGPRGPIKVVADQNCPSDRAFMLQMDTWKLYSLREAPHIENLDGLKMLREDSADAHEIRVRYYAQLGSRGPGLNCNIKLS